MGGSLGLGNRSSVAEFNILCDPEAAEMVCRSGVPLVMVPLQVTHTAIVTTQIMERIAHVTQPPFSTLLHDLLSFFQDTYRTVFGFTNGPPLHDPCAVAYVIDKALFKGRSVHMQVVTGDHLCAGQTVCDVWKYSDQPPNVYVCESMDVEAFWTLLLDAFQQANAHSPLIMR
jgi:inosine-uridine nucleoside N-ribohydrolase